MAVNITTRNLSLTSKLGNRLIKFRHGPQATQQSATGAQQTQGTSRPIAQKSQGNTEAIWDFQIPARWRRAPISEEECAVINNGGPL